MEGRSWSHPPIIGTAPAARCAHSANVFEGKLIVFGGGDGNRRFKDLYLLDSGASPRTVTSHTSLYTKDLTESVA